jgi:hypothetical protein
VILLTLLIRFAWQSLTSKNITWFVSINAIHVFFHAQLELLSSSGSDLNEEGTLLSYYFDIIYIGWFVLIFSCFSECNDKDLHLTFQGFYWTYIVIPVYAVYKLSHLVKIKHVFHGNS